MKMVSCLAGFGPILSRPWQRHSGPSPLDFSIPSQTHVSATDFPVLRSLKILSEFIGHVSQTTPHGTVIEPQRNKLAAFE